jgi:ferredoxin
LSAAITSVPAPSLRFDHARPGYDACTGCNLCVLPCPVFRETRDLALTLRGRAKALQAGASFEDIRPSLEACVTCGACEPVCPEDIDTVGFTLEARARLRLPIPLPATQPSHREGPGLAIIEAPRALLGGDERLAERLGVEYAHDDGRDLADALECGLPLDDERLSQFLSSLSACRELIVADGRLHAPLRRWLPGVRVRGIAESLIPRVRAGLGSTDLLVLDSRGYHADFARLVGFWDDVRKSTGAQMALDLHRIAIPTGAGAVRADFPIADQARWLLEGRTVSRIVCETPHDAAALRSVTATPVVLFGSLA